MNRKKFGFTIVELLTVITIIALLVGILLPALNLVRTKAKQIKQRACLTTIELALTAFRNDYGDYPPSDNNTGGDYCGAQKLSEALLGQDLMGFDPKSTWTSNDIAYPQPPDVNNLNERKGPYLEQGTVNAFKLKDIFTQGNLPLASQTFVLCDVFGTRKVSLGTKTVSAGAPILYYRANTSSKDMNNPDLTQRIYNSLDNQPLIRLERGFDGIPQPLLDDSFFYSSQFILDPRVSISWPYRPDSYILVSAGADGIYGTNDDIYNFGN